MGVFAAQAAAHATVDHRSYRIHLERVGVVLESEGGTARQPDAGVIPGADVFVHAVLDANGALAGLQQAGNPGFQTALPFQLALTLGDDHLQPGILGGEGFSQRAPHLIDAIGMHGAHPSNPHPAQGLLDGLVLVRQALLLVRGIGARVFVRRRDDFLRSRRRRIPVLEDQQDRVILVEQGRLHTGKQTVVPETAVSHDG